MRRAVLFFFISAQNQRWLIALGLSALVHGGLLLGQRPSAQPAAAAAARRAVLQTRTVAAAPVAATATTTATLAADLAPVERAAPRPHPVEARPQAPPAVVAAPATTAALTLPAATEISYLLRQMGQEGTARLSWQPQSSGGYQLSLERELAGRALPTLRSEGETGSQGLAPSRYAQQRDGRDTRATNFRRDEGVISFSASAEQFALTPGLQDRLSWWLQLAAVIAAAPARYPPGSSLSLNVVGLRGEAREWVFEVVGPEPVVLADGLSLSPAALHLRRPPLGAYGGGIEVWLAPDRDYLPIRVRVGQQDERGWELLLRP